MRQVKDTWRIRLRRLRQGERRKLNKMKQSSTFYAGYGKRLFDLILTIPGLVVISPLLAVIALLVRVKLGSPVLFRQERAE